MAKKRTAKPEKAKKAKAAGKTKLKLAKGGAKKKTAPAARAARPARSSTVKPTPAAPAAAENHDDTLSLGPIELPSAEDSLRVLRELAELNDRALKAHKRYEDLKADAKTAKERWDALAEQLQTRLRQATHKSDLPLFADVEQREQDQTAMQAGGEIPGSGEPGDAPAGQGDPDQGTGTVEEIEPPAAGGGLEEAMGDPPPPASGVETGQGSAEFL